MAKVLKSGENLKIKRQERWCPCAVVVQDDGMVKLQLLNDDVDDDIFHVSSVRMAVSKLQSVKVEEPDGKEKHVVQLQIVDRAKGIWLSLPDFEAREQWIAVFRSVKEKASDYSSIDVQTRRSLPQEMLRNAAANARGDGASSPLIESDAERRARSSPGSMSPTLDRVRTASMGSLGSVGSLNDLCDRPRANSFSVKERMMDKPYFRYGMAREVVEKLLLQSAKPGQFIVRTNAREDMVISVRGISSVHHFKVDKKVISRGNVKYSIGADEWFTSMEGLIAGHQTDQFAGDAFLNGRLSLSSDVVRADLA